VSYVGRETPNSYQFFNKAAMHRVLERTLNGVDFGRFNE